jgi:thioredoxin 1
MKATSLQSDNFDSTLANAGKPVLVDFWAEWCGPCRLLGPVIDELAEEQEGKAVIAKVNIDEAQDLAIRYGVTSIPTLMMVCSSGPGVQSWTLQGVR